MSFEKSLTGALEIPQLPTISVVTPWRMVLSASRLACNVQSLWL